MASASFWVLLPLAFGHWVAAMDISCLDSIKVIDNFLSDQEASDLLAQLEVTGPDAPERVRHEQPAVAQRLKSELRSQAQLLQVDSAVEVLEPVGNIKVMITGDPGVERRLRAAMLGKDLTELEAVKTTIPVSIKSGHVYEHADHLNGSPDAWAQVDGTAAVTYLESAPDGGAVGKLVFKDIRDGSKVVKEVEAVAKRFISWENGVCTHSFEARYDGPRRLIGPLALTSYGGMVIVGPPTLAPPTTTTETTTMADAKGKGYYFRPRKHWFMRKKAKKAAASSVSSAELVQDSEVHGDSVHFVQLPSNDSGEEL